MVELNNSKKAFSILQQHFNPDAEEVWILALNSQLKLIKKEMLFKGTVNSCPFHARDIFRFLVLQNAASFILAHNHPSQDPKPSRRDIQITHKLQKLALLLEMPLVDHIVFTESSYYSLANAGKMKPIEKIRL